MRCPIEVEFGNRSSFKKRELPITPLVFPAEFWDNKERTMNRKRTYL